MNIVPNKTNGDSAQSQVRKRRPLKMNMLHASLLVILMTMMVVGGVAFSSVFTKAVRAASHQASAGVPYHVGDVFAGVGNGLIRHYSPTGVLLDTLDTGSGSAEVSGMCFDAAGNLRSTNFTASNMSLFDNKGDLIQFPWGSSFNSHPESCVIDAAGDVYVGQADGTKQILKFDPAGKLLATYSPAVESRGTDWIDLESDQCTMLYTSEGTRVKSFNVCTNTQNPDFATGLSSPCFALRIRPDGEVMVTCRTQTYRLSATGAVLATYPIPGQTLFSMNLDPDNEHFWVGSTSSRNVYKVDIATGAGTTAPVFTAEGPRLSGLAVFGEPTNAIPLAALNLDKTGKIDGNTVTYILTPRVEEPVGSVPAGTSIPIGTTITVTDELPPQVFPPTPSEITQTQGTPPWTITVNGHVVTAMLTVTSTITPPAILPEIIITTQLAPDVAPCSLIHDQATISAPNTEPVTVVNELEVIVPGCGVPASLSLSKSGSISGNTVRYTLTPGIAETEGSIPAGTPITITDELPAEVVPPAASEITQTPGTPGWTITVNGHQITATLIAPSIIIAPETLPEITIPAQLAAGVALCSVIYNQATISAPGLEPVTVVHELEVPGPVCGVAALGLNKTGSISGNTVTYTLTPSIEVMMGSISAGTPITVTDALPPQVVPPTASTITQTPGTPAWTFSVNGHVVTATLTVTSPITAPESLPEIIIPAQLAPNVVPCSFIRNQATISAPSLEPVTVVNELEVIGPGCRFPVGLGLSKAGSISGNTVRYTLTPTIDETEGNIPAGTTITITDELPPQVVPPTASEITQTPGTPAWTISVNGHQVTATLTTPTIITAPETLPEIIIPAQLAAGVAPCSVIHNQATLSAPNLEPVTVVHKLEVPGTSCSVPPSPPSPVPAAFSLSKTGVRHGDVISYTLQPSIVGNSGSIPANTVITLTDTLPTQLTLLPPVLQSASTTLWIIHVSGNTITATLTAPSPNGIAAGTALPAITFNASINPGVKTGTIIENEATISAPGHAPVSASSTIEVGAQQQECPHVASWECKHNNDQNHNSNNNSTNSKNHGGSSNGGKQIIVIKESNSNSKNHSSGSDSKSHSSSHRHPDSRGQSHHAIVA